MLEAILQAHGLERMMNVKKERTYLKEIAHLTAYIDIDERTVTSQGKFYDLFDGTNNHSAGQIISQQTALTGAVLSGSSVIIVGNTSLFEVGQEITIVDVVNIESKRILGINGNQITIEKITHNYYKGALVCRSSATTNDTFKFGNLVFYNISGTVL